MAGTLEPNAEKKSSGETLTGVFAGPVSGLRYQTPTTMGVTNALGEFLYRPGEAITFLVGRVVLGTTKGCVTGQSCAAGQPGRGQYQQAARPLGHQSRAVPFHAGPGRRSGERRRDRAGGARHRGFEGHHVRQPARGGRGVRSRQGPVRQRSRRCGSSRRAQRRSGRFHDEASPETLRRNGRMQRITEKHPRQSSSGRTSGFRCGMAPMFAPTCFAPPTRVTIPSS